jgi:hypothetical protein
MSNTYQFYDTNDHGYIPLVVNTSQSFPHSRLTTGFVTRVTQQVPLVEQELPTLPEYLSSPPVFSHWSSCYSIFSCICMFCRSLFGLLYFFFWPLCCLFFFDIRILIAPLVSSNSSYSLCFDPTGSEPTIYHTRFTLISLRFDFRTHFLIWLEIQSS